MVDSNKTDNVEQVYRATFTLEQEGLKGPITPKMSLDPMVNPMTEEVPAIYEYISTMAMNFLRQVRAVDDNNEVLDEDQWSRVGLDVMTDDVPDKGTLN
jgi:hypothetical protein